MRKIITQRLIIRRYNLKDVPSMVLMLNDYSIHRFTHVPFPYTKQIAKSFAVRRERRNLHLGVFLRNTGELVSGVGLKDIDRKDRTAELGYLCSKKHRNKGYVTEAANAMLYFGFYYLGLNRIKIDCNKKNKASFRVITKLGAQKEAILKGAIPWKSGWEDKITNSITKDEFSIKNKIGNSGNITKMLKHIEIK